jgi:hypothetical protein
MRGSTYSFISLFGRASGAGTTTQTGYRLRVKFDLLGHDVWTLSKIVMGVETDLGSGVLRLVADDALELAMDNSTITASRIRAGVRTTAVQVMDETSIETGGKIGFGVSGSDGYTPAAADDFDGGNTP